MRKVLFALPIVGNNHEVLTCLYNVLAGNMIERGWDVTLTHPQQPDFLYKILTIGQDEDAILFLGHFFFDLRISAQNHFKDTKIGDLVRSRIGVKIGDHPFTEFMWERIDHMHPRSFIFSSEPEYFEAAKCIQPGLQNFAAVPPTIFYVDKTRLVPFDERPIDLFVPMSFAKGRSVDEVLSGYAPGSDVRKLAEASYEALRHNRTEYPLTVVRRIVKDMFGVDLPLDQKNRQTMFKIFSMLSEIDFCIRMERRLELLSGLLKDTGGKKVYIIDHNLPAALKTDNVVALAPVDATRLGELMGQSRLVAHAHPTYPNGLHERVVNAMASGCVVVSDSAPCLHATFREGEEWVCADGRQGLREIMNGLGADRLARMSETAYRRAWTDFHPGKHMDQILRAMSAL